MGEHRFTVCLDYEGGVKGDGGLTGAGLTSRFSVPESLGGSGVGTNPEELLLSAAASCYAITLSAIVARRGLGMARLDVETLGFVDANDGLRFARIVHRPAMTAQPGATPEQRASLLEVARIAERACMVSSALRGNVEVEVEPTVGGP
jgi:peroxiredoxin-like protein